MLAQKILSYVDLFSHFQISKNVQSTCLKRAVSGKSWHWTIFFGHNCPRPAQPRCWHAEAMMYGSRITVEHVMVEEEGLFCSVVSVEPPVLCFPYPFWLCPLICYFFFYSTQTVKSFYHVVYSCAQVLTVVMEGTGSGGAQPDKSDRLKKTTTLFPIIPCSKSLLFLAAGKGASIMSLYFSVFFHIDLLLLLGYHYYYCCCSVAVVIKIQKIINGKNNKYDVK